MKPIGILYIALAVLLLGGIVGGVYYFGFHEQAIIYQGKEVKLLVPIVESIKCDILDTSTSSHSIPESGIWLSKDDLGINTKTLRNIKIGIEPKWFGACEFKLSICDPNKNNCGTTKISMSGRSSYELNDLDLTFYSYHIYDMKCQKYPLIWSSAPSTIAFTYDKYGLKIFSLSISLAGKTICTSSCDLSCPEQEFRKGIKANGLKFLIDLIVRPVYYFFFRFIWLKGFKDGLRGLFISFSSSFTVFVYKIKLWELWQKKE